MGSSGLRVKRNDFACSCSDEGKARCAKVLAWAQRWAEATPENFLTRAIYELNWRWNASITDIANDMWSAIVTVKPEIGTSAEWSTYIQCDRLEDGLAFTLRAYYDKYGKGNDWR